MQNNSKQKIIIIGGGYAGISLIHKLKNNKNLDITLIDKSKNHLLQTHIHKYISGHYSKDDITFDHANYCKNNGIGFLCEEVSDINFKENYLLTRQTHLYHYDYLVIATGAISIFPKSISNIIEYTKDIKDINNLDYYKQKFSKLLNKDTKNAKVLVVGGGVSGLQIACEMAYKAQEKELSKENIEFTLIEGMDTVLPGMDPFLIQKATQRCEQLGINIVTSLFASEIYEDKIILSNKQEIPYDILLFVIGAVGNKIETKDEKIEQNPRNQVIVDDYYRLSPYKNIFAIGDIVQALDTNTKQPQAPTAQAARMQAELVASNIQNSINNKDLIKNNISNKGILIDLGGPSCAIGKLFSINLWGKPALWLKKLIYSLHAKKLT